MTAFIGGRRKAVAPPCASGSSYSPVLAVPEEPSLTGPAIANSIVAFQTLRRSDEVEARPAVPLMVVLCDELVAGCGLQPEALRDGLKALAGLGVWGVSVNVWWGVVEQEACSYDWGPMAVVLSAAREAGLRVRVSFCFHADERHALPAWVLAAGRDCPDIFPTDRAGNRSMECLSIGVDHVPALAGRTALQTQSDLLAAFRKRFAPLIGGVVTDAELGLGPRGELRYPSTPLDARWNFPGIGEFQCYDRFMIASLSAAAQQVGQPHWGSSGPHDAGSYCQWPHQTGFFHHQGSWDSEYGRFFMQWYAASLIRHADDALAGAAAALAGAGVALHARLPTIHWWYNQAAHAAELTAGLYNTSARNGYLALCQVLARHSTGLVLTGGEMRDCEQPSYALASPEALLLQLRATAASQQVPVTLCNLAERYDADALSELERKAFAGGCYAGIELGRADGLLFSAMGATMFEPSSWPAFKSWAGRVAEHNAAIAAERAPRARRSSGTAAAAAAAAAAMRSAAATSGGSSRAAPDSTGVPGVEVAALEQQSERESALAV